MIEQQYKIRYGRYAPLIMETYQRVKDFASEDGYLQKVELMFENNFRAYNHFVLKRRDMDSYDKYVRSKLEKIVQNYKE